MYGKTLGYVSFSSTLKKKEKQSKPLLWSGFVGGLLIGIIIGLGGCASTASSERKQYLSIFENEESSFRGVNIGDKIAVVKKNNPNEKPLYEDLLGLKYKYPQQAGIVWASYYIDNLRSGRESNQVTAITIEINWENEVETAHLYEEIHHKFVQKYGFPTGNYGDFLWESQAYRTEIHLRLRLETRQIFLYFIEIP